MSDNIRDMVEDPNAHPEIDTAQNLPDAANAGQSLQGYAAINGVVDDEIARRAYDYYVQRQREGLEGTADGDWFRAESEVRRTRGALNA